MSLSTVTWVDCVCLENVSDKSYSFHRRTVALALASCPRKARPPLKCGCGGPGPARQAQSTGRMESRVRNGGERLRLPSIRIALHRISSISRLSPLPGLGDYALHKSVRVGDNDRGPVELCARAYLLQEALLLSELSSHSHSFITERCSTSPRWQGALSMHRIAHILHF